MAYKVAVIGGKSATDGMGYAAYFAIGTRLDLLSIPPKMSKRLGGIMGCKHKTSLWHLNGFPYGGNNIVGQQYNIGEKLTVVLYTYIINRHAGTPEKQRNKNIVV